MKPGGLGARYVRGRAVTVLSPCDGDFSDGSRRIVLDRDVGSAVGLWLGRGRGRGFGRRRWTGEAGTLLGRIGIARGPCWTKELEGAGSFRRFLRLLRARGLGALA